VTRPHYLILPMHPAVDNSFALAELPV
jgi:hypothetical protein